MRRGRCPLEVVATVAILAVLVLMMRAVIVRERYCEGYHVSNTKGIPQAVKIYTDDRTGQLPSSCSLGLLDKSKTRNAKALAIRRR